LEQARQRYQFVVVGYVVMPEHFHLLLSEPEKGDPSVVMKVVIQRFARLVRKGRRSSTAQSRFWPAADPSQVWQKRFYDFNVWSAAKEIEKLRYIHRNPVKRGLVSKPDQWIWSSFRSYAYGEQGRVRINVQEWPLAIQQAPRATFGCSVTPLIRTGRE
jgi:putative transposase